MNFRYSKYLPVSIYLSDILLLNLSLLIAVNSHSTDWNYNNASFIVFIISNLSWVPLSYISRSFIVHRPLVLSDNLNRFFVTLTYHLIVLFASLFFMELEASRYVILLYLLIFFTSIILHRSMLFFSLDYLRKKGFNHRSILILGDQKIAERLKNNFVAHPEYGYDQNGYLSTDELTKCSDQQITELIHKNSTSEIYVCYKEIDSCLMERVINICEKNSVKINVVSDLLLNSAYAKLINYGTLPILNLSRFNSEDFKLKVLKRGFDLSFSAGVMISGIPLFAVIMVVTKLTSKGPIFYKQTRVGKNGKPFYIYKFRSMRTDAEHSGPQLAKKDDPRVTSWGRVMRKTRLDELPQFYNVLKGDMSIVGPRPERQHFIEKIIEKAPRYSKLLSIKPGITSIGQVKYGYAENIDEMVRRMRFDLVYLNNQKLKVDLSVILQTVKVMVQAKGK
ncbi:MAG TPA: sugar transferase [Sphingobacteriaceae bacterium]|nr:sugar transferase [Sphingobacteriaceae bacterium]